MVDLLVLEVQEWLNDTYGDHSQWNYVSQDGLTGWGTIYGLIRGLQIELGITTLADNFGGGTMSAFTSQIGTISSSTTNANVIHLAQGALWCKGYSGGSTWGVYNASTQTAVQSVTAAMGLTATTNISGKVLKSLMSMDAYTLLSGGTSDNRAVQQWLNGNYNGRSAWTILPCDGLFSRNTQQGMMYAIQYEIGMSDSVANGNFGTGTKSGLQTYAGVSLGSVDSSANWVRLFQGALRFNGYASPFSGTFDSATESATEEFQSYAELSVSGSGDYRTWASLLISTGDETRPGTASDMATQLTPAMCSDLYNNGYRTVGRYLTVTSKRYIAGELASIFAAGLRTFPIMQEANTSASDFSYTKGEDHGLQALVRLRQLGFTDGVTVFFAVDYDATDDGITSYVAPYFEGLNATLNSSHSTYRVGVYGTRNVCSRLINAGLAAEAFIASMSWGWSGNLGYKLPPSWSYDQIQNLTLSGSSLEIDKNIQSVRAAPAGSGDVLPTPVTTVGGELAFQEDYFWYIAQLSVHAERAEPDFISVANEFVLTFLQKPTYWSGAGTIGDFFRVYTPIVEDAITTEPIRGQIAAARESFESSSAQPATGVADRIRHWAATTRSYTNWGVGASGSRGIGDYGGWAGDLAKAWQEYTGVAGSPDIRAWFAGNVGGASAEFGESDLIEDVDGYLCAWMIDQNLDRSIADCVREIEYECALDPSWRYRKFYATRFDNSRTWIESAAAQVFTPVTVDVFSLPTALLIGGTTFPSATQSAQLAQGFADALIART